MSVISAILFITFTCSEGCVEMPRVWDPVGELLSAHPHQHFEVLFFFKAWVVKYFAPQMHHVWQVPLQAEG